MNTVLKGENMMLFMKESALTGITPATDKWVCLGHATSCSFNLNVDSLDISSKDSGSWAASKPSRKSWDASSDCLHTMDYDRLMKLAIDRTEFDILFCAAVNTESGNAVTHTPSNLPEGAQADSFKCYSGRVWINSISQNSPNGDAASYSISLTGTGALDTSATIPTISIATNINLLSIVQGQSAQVIVSNYTGTLSAVCSDANTTATFSDEVCTISVGASATTGGSYVTISDSGTGTEAIVYVTIIES